MILAIKASNENYFWISQNGVLFLRRVVAYFGPLFTIKFIVPKGHKRSRPFRGKPTREFDKFVVVAAVLGFRLH